jgi:hypothetical protein
MSRDAYREWYRMKGIVPHGEEPARSFTRIQRILAFNEQSVRYLVVGGYALVRYAEPRVTKDLDIFRT